MKLQILVKIIVLLEKIANLIIISQLFVDVKLIGLGKVAIKK